MINKQLIDNQIIEDYKNLVNIQTIKDKYHTSHERISRVCTEAGVFNRDERTAYKRKHQKDHLRDVKHNPFENLSDPNVQYWLGMLATDGCINGTHISLSSSTKDIEHLEKFRKFVGSNLKITSCKDKRFKDSSVSCFGFSNEEVRVYLSDLGITNKKSFTLKINFPITKDFVRGAIDGDGCLYKGVSKHRKNLFTISIVSASEAFANQISQFYTDNNIKHHIFSRTRKGNKIIHRVSVSNFVNCLKATKLLYEGAETYLKRKHDKAQLILNHKYWYEKNYGLPNRQRL